MKLCLSVYGELYRIELENVLYFQADDHYTIVYYTSGTHFMMPFGLSKVEAAISEIMTDNKFLVRLSRKYIVNLMRVFHINVLKQVLVLNDDSGSNVTLRLPKQTLRILIGMIDNRNAGNS